MREILLAKNYDERQTSSEVKAGPAGLVLGWVTSFEQKPLYRCCYFLYFKQIFFYPLLFFFSNAKTYEKRAFSKCYTLHTRLQLMWIDSDLGHYYTKSLMWRPDLHACAKTHQGLTSSCKFEKFSRKISTLKRRKVEFTAPRQSIRNRHKILYARNMFAQ